MDKKICIHQFFKSEFNKRTVDNYIQSCYFRKQFKHNNKTRLWHIKRLPALKEWVERNGVKI